MKIPPPWESSVGHPRTPCWPRSWSFGRLKTRTVKPLTFLGDPTDVILIADRRHQKNKKNNTQMFIVYGKYKNCTSKNLFGLLPKGSSFLKKWMFKSMNLNSIIWSQSYNWGGMCKITNEHPCHPKKVRQWCQNKTKTSYPHPPRKTNIKTP